MIVQTHFVSFILYVTVLKYRLQQLDDLLWNINCPCSNQVHPHLLTFGMHISINILECQLPYLKFVYNRGAWVAKSVECLTSFRLRLWFQGCGIEPCISSVLSMEPA